LALIFGFIAVGKGSPYGYHHMAPALMSAVHPAVHAGVATGLGSSVLGHTAWKLHALHANPSCTRTVPWGGWGGAYRGSVIIRSSACAPTHSAYNAFGWGGYYATPRFATSRCGADWWVQFKQGPVYIPHIGFSECDLERGSTYNFWGCRATKAGGLCMPGSAYRIAYGTAAVISQMKFNYLSTYHKYGFNMYGFSAASCGQYVSRASDYYWSIKNLHMYPQMLAPTALLPAYAYARPYHANYYGYGYHHPVAYAPGYGHHGLYGYGYGK